MEFKQFPKIVSIKTYVSGNKFLIQTNSMFNF